MKTNPSGHRTRRDALKTGLAASSILATGGTGLISAAAPIRSNLVAKENAKPGTTDWHLDHVEKDTSRIQGYASRQSVSAGEKIEFKVSTKPASGATRPRKSPRRSVSRLKIPRHRMNFLESILRLIRSHAGDGMPFRTIVVLIFTVLGMPANGAYRFSESFDNFDSTRFRTKIPNKNTEVRNGALWTRGKSGGKYPPMVYLDVAGRDLEISFRYRHLQNGGMMWFFVDGDDGFGSVDHMLRVKLLRTGVQLQIDAHSLDPNHPDRQNNGRPPDKVSGAYRLNIRHPQEPLDLSANMWRTVKLVFVGDTVEIAVDGKSWSKTLKHSCFNGTKRKLLWMQNGGPKGIEIDDIRIREIVAAPEWTLFDSGITNSIRGIGAVAQNVCWIGTKSGVARTIDGGQNWRFTKIGGEELDFRDIHAFDAQRCLAMSAGTGNASRIYLTKDGGKTWKLVHQNQEAKGFFNGFAFRDKHHGVLAGDAVDGRLFLLVTKDGGAIWQRMARHTAPQMNKEEHAFAASGTHLTVNQAGHIWVSSGGKLARIFHSPDWGQTWTTIATPMIAGEPSTGIFSIAFHGANGMAVGGDYRKESEGRNNAMQSNDGGRTWNLITNKNGAAPFAFRSCIGYVDAKTLIVAGPSGTDVSYDGGTIWQSLPDKVGFHTFSIADGNVWAAGAEGRVGRLQLSR